MQGTFTRQPPGIFPVALHHPGRHPRPDGDQCATATVVGEGSWPGTTIGFDPDYDATCGDVTDLDAAFELLEPEPEPDPNGEAITVEADEVQDFTIVESEQILEDEQ